MNKRLLSTSFFLATVCVCPAILATDETFQPDPAKEPSVTVLCHGRLRHGVLAMGGETTGTTITFDRLTWELQLPDEASRDFASRHHKDPVIVTGVLRRVAGTENIVRWIVDVNELEIPDSQDIPEQSAKVTIRGTLRAALSKTGDTPELSVSTDGQIWKLDLSANKKLQTVAESLIGESVMLSGRVESQLKKAEHKTANSRDLATHVVQVETLEASVGSEAESISAAPQFFR